MAYININEYDRTITGPKTYSTNIVAIPLNAIDGPSDRWITVNTYDEFIQLFGPNPDTVSQFGNSWEYAANLLLREMPVCVRRITHKLNEDGTNSPELLSGVNIAKGILKVKDITGNGTVDPNVLTTSEMRTMDYSKSSILKTSEPGTQIADNNYKSKINHPNAASLTESEYKYIDTPLTSIYELQKGGQQQVNYNGEIYNIYEENINISGAFVDVDDDGTKYPFIKSNNEWTFIGGAGIPNDHYKNTYESEEEFRKVCQGISGQAGDFCVVKKENKEYRYDYSKQGENNPLFLSGNVKIYPWDLDEIDTTKGMFTDVEFDAMNSESINAIWVYNPEVQTLVKNPNFIEGPHKFTYNGKTFNVFKNKEEFQSLDASEAQFLVLVNNYDAYNKNESNTDLKYFVYVRNNLDASDSDSWGETSITLDALTSDTKLNNEDMLNMGVGFDVRIFKTICWEPVIDEKSKFVAQNSGEYSHKFNWVDSGETEFLTRLYWKDTGRKAGYSAHSKLQNTRINMNHVIISSNSTTSTTSLHVEINDDRSIEIAPDNENNKLISGKISFTNFTELPINVYELKINQRLDSGEINNIYDLGIRAYKNGATGVKITTDSALKAIDGNGNEISANQFVKYDAISDRWYVEMAAGMTFTYNRNLTNAYIDIKFAGFNYETNNNDALDVEFRMLESSSGYYSINLSSTPGNILTTTKIAAPITEATDEDINNLPSNDGYGNYNMFIVEYKYPGTNGNSLKAAIRTISNRGIFIYVYRNNQVIEQIELCSFRYRGSNGRVGILNQDYDKDRIWKVVLSKFGISLDPNIPTRLMGIFGNYINVYMNKNITNYHSLDYINSLYAQTGTQICSLTGGSNPSEEHIIHEVQYCYEPLKDKYRYDIKFVSNGGFIDEITYPKDVSSTLYNFGNDRLIEDAMLDLAMTRKDCIAYLDTPYDLTLDLVPEYFQHLSTSYAAAYDPWCLIALDTGYSKWMPPSFVQLFTHAKAILNGNKTYLPPAGVKRASVPEIIATNHELSSDYILDWQSKGASQFINPIIWISGFDYTIYGQKTLYNLCGAESSFESALQNLNVRLVANEIKKLIFKSCISLTFELNNIMTWNEFKSKIIPELLTMQGEGVLTDYEVLMGTETMTVADLNSGHIVGTVRASIASAVTDWDINFEITPNSVTFSEIDYNSTYSGE